MSQYGLLLVIGALGLTLTYGAHRTVDGISHKVTRWSMGTPLQNFLTQRMQETRTRTRRQITSDYCANWKPCLNGGTCKPDTTNLYVCTCAPGFKGPRCELHYCANWKPCLNGGTCKPDRTKLYVCACAPGFKGPRCELRCDLDFCLSDYDKAVAQLPLDPSQRERNRVACSSLADTLVDCVTEGVHRDDAVCACSDRDVERSANAMLDKETFVDANCFATGFQCQDPKLQSCGDQAWVAYNTVMKVSMATGQEKTQAQFELDAIMNSVMQCANESQQTGKMATGCMFDQWLLDIPPEQVPNYIKLLRCPVKSNDPECQGTNLCNAGQMDEAAFETSLQCVLIKAAQKPDSCQPMSEFISTSKSYMRRKMQRECQVKDTINSFKKSAGCPALSLKRYIRGGLNHDTKMTLRDLGAKLKSIGEFQPTKNKREERIETIVELIKNMLDQKQESPKA